MKKFLCLALAVVLALSCAVFPALAESHPLMYKVTDKDGHSIYLLGTMHIISQDTLPIAKLDEILGQVDRVIFEVSEENMELLANGGASEEDANQQGLTMNVENNGLSDETIGLVTGFLSAAYGQEANPDAVRQIAAPVLAQMLANQFMVLAGYDASGHGVDLEVFRKAKELNLKIEGAETMEEQMNAINAEGGGDTASIEKQILEMMNEPEKFKDQLDGMVNAYNTGDKDALLKIFTAEGARSSADAGRNARFLEVAEKALADGGRTLIAIGVYHIIAEDGLFNTLTQAGYTVEAL